MILPPASSAVLDRVRHLHLRARQIVAGLHHGSRRSLRLGHDQEFADYKPYTAGDSLRDVDWKAFGRSDRLVVRRYRAETEMSATILLDASADLASTPQKFEQAIVLAAALCWFLHLEREPVGLAIGAGEGIPLRWLPPAANRGHIARLLTALSELKPAGKAGLDTWLRATGEHLRPRSLLLLISDFAEEPATWAPSLDALAQHRVDLRAFQIYDARETGLVWDRPLQLFSPEAPQARPIDPQAMRGLFMEEVQRFFGEVGSAVRQRRGHHYLMEAQADLVPLLSRFIRGAP